MFDEELTFCGEHGFARYVLTRRPETQSSSTKGKLRRLEEHFALRIILASLRDAAGNPNWRLIRFLRLDQQPYNHRCQVEAIVHAQLTGVAKLFLFEEEQVEHPIGWRPLPAEEEARADVRRSAARALDFLDVQIIDDDGEALAGERFELLLPNGERRTVFTDERGVVYVDKIPAGTCSLRR